jgi:hypothetical protein
MLTLNMDSQQFGPLNHLKMFIQQGSNHSKEKQKIMERYYIFEVLIHILEVLIPLCTR